MRAVLWPSQYETEFTIQNWVTYRNAEFSKTVIWKSCKGKDGEKDKRLNERKSKFTKQLYKDSQDTPYRHQGLRIKLHNENLGRIRTPISQGKLSRGIIYI